METIGSKISQIRKTKGLTQEELSELSKINLRTLQRIEKDESEPRGNTLRNLCQALDVNLEELIDYNKVDDLRFIKIFHLSVLVFVVIPLGNILLPLILWLTKRDKIIGLNEQGINLLNFQILWTIFLNTFIFLYAYIKISHTADPTICSYLVIALLIVNIVYPFAAYIQLDKGKIKPYYFSPIKFLK